MYLQKIVINKKSNKNISFKCLQGTPEQKIIFTAQTNAAHNEVNVPEPRDYGARLVDGPSPLAGRLQMLYKDKWRSVCTNSRK